MKLTHSMLTLKISTCQKISQRKFRRKINKKQKLKINTQNMQNRIQNHHKLMTCEQLKYLIAVYT